MVHRNRTALRRSLALLLALCVALYQTAISAHDLLHWHAHSHTLHEAYPTFAEHLVPRAEDDHDDAWFEQLLCTLTANGAVAKACVPFADATWPPQLAGLQALVLAPRLATRTAWRALPPSRGPPGLQ
ncbi:MAG: hypothetical protein AAGA11_18180 [Pseudomonadota bacterium]